MQRILSLATLGVLGGLVWMFLSGGGLNQLAQNANAPATSQPGAWNQEAVFNWPTTSAPATPAGQATMPPIMQPAAAPTAPTAATGPTIKIASYNIQVFGQAKAGKPAVIETIAAVIRQFDVVAIQEIRVDDEYFVPNFVKYLNQTGRHYDCVVGPRLGNSTSKEQYAFIFDADRIVCSKSSVYTVGDPDNLLQREPLVATFATRANADIAFTFTLINVHTTPDPANVLHGELDALAEVYRVVRRAGGNEDDVIMLGDFNADDRGLGRLGQLPSVTPLIRGVSTNTLQNKLYDNILIHQPSTTEFVGRSNVFNLMRQYNLALAQAQEVSDHFPVYAEFSAYERDQSFNVVSRSGVVR